MDDSDFSSGQSSETTTGNFQTEQEACKFFDEVISASDLFNVYSEVSGKMLYKRFWKEDKTDIRIDRILVPKTKLLENGWSMGIAGVEIKRSGKKIGPPLAQAGDYLDACYFITSGQYAIQISHVFLFPLGKLHNNLASICSQNRIGQLDMDRYRIYFRCGESTLLYYNITTGQINVSINKNGKKIGSR